MRPDRKICPTPLAIAVLLALCGCSCAAGEQPAHGAADEGGVTIAATFLREDGDALRGGVVRLSAGGEQADYPLAGSGEVELSGLPRDGGVELSILDAQGQLVGTVTFSISQGAVIDAAADGSGSGHITLKEDTDRVAVRFVLGADGTLSCALRLAQDGPDGS